MLDAFLVRVLAFVSGSFLLACPAPGEEADIENHAKPFVFVGRKASARFWPTLQKVRNLEHRRAENSKKNASKTEAREAKNIVPKSAFGEASVDQNKARSQKNDARIGPRAPRSDFQPKSQKKLAPTRTQRGPGRRRPKRQSWRI